MCKQTYFVLDGVISLHNLLTESLNIFLHLLLLTIQFRHLRFESVDFLFVVINFTLLANEL